MKPKVCVVKSVVRGVGAVVLAGVMLLGAAAGAQAAAPQAAAHESAALSPDRGPTTGGTVVSVPSPAGVAFTSISAGYSHSIAIGTDGNAYAWGDNFYGQLGDGTTTERLIPVRVQTPDGVTFVSVSAGGSFTLAIGSDGHTYAWGYNWYGQLGDGSRDDSTTPVQVQTPDGVSFESAAAGNFHAIALASDGRSYAWGDNSIGQLGNGTDLSADVPVPVHSPDGVTFERVAAGQSQSLAIGDDQNTYAWGDNWAGQLGDGSTESSALPVRVLAPDAITFTDVATGGSYSEAIGSDGYVYAWGNNSSGQLGDGTGENSTTPVRVQTPTDIEFTELVGGFFHSAAIASNGTTYAWGDNGFGQLGDGTAEVRLAPVLVQAPHEVEFVSVAADGSHSIAIGSNGATYSWGNNLSGQLGDGTNTARAVPARVSEALEILVTGITFGDADGTDLSKHDDGNWSIATPAHDAGTVDVMVSWQLGSISQTPILYVKGFTYQSNEFAPTISGLEDRTVTAGDEATFTVHADGSPRPTIQWQVLRGPGASWEPVVTSGSRVLSADSMTFTVRPSLAENGHQYRAIATNSVGSVTSAPATLTVTSGGASLPATGSGSECLLLGGAFGALLLGATTLMAARASSRRIGELR